MPDLKKSLLANYKYVVLNESDKHFQFLKDDEELERWHGDGSLANGDVVVQLTPETTRVAVLKNFIELQ